MAPVFVPCVVWTASSCVVCMARAKRDTRYPWMDSALPRSLPRGRPPLHLIVLEDIILFVIQEIVLIVLVHILHWGIQCEDVVLLVVLPFIEAFQRCFDGLYFLLLLLFNVFEGCGDARCLWLLIHVGERRRLVQGVVDRGHDVTQGKIRGGKRGAHFTRPRIQGMAFHARLHADRAYPLPKMLLGIADDLVGHCLSQRVVRFVMDGDTRHGNAPLPSGHGAA